ncbi:glycoprotein hormone alpha-2 [Mirounga angustirostris]|uniref:glycoprotein hormone alpha-2 n=1 Tax=Mirounga angustirostris TaxID=9716 RepID=UPI00313D089E
MGFAGVDSFRLFQEAADPQEGVAPERWQIKIRRAGTVWRRAGDLRNPFRKPLSSWALEVIPMASPQMLLLCLLVLAVTEGWGRQAAIPGCHLHPFNVTVRSDRQGTCQGSHVAQACVGHCESSAFPSRYSVLVASGYRHNVTSVSQCCTISGLKKVKVPLQCGGDRREELEIFTARACQCDMCRLSRY